MVASYHSCLRVSRIFKSIYILQGKTTQRTHNLCDLTATICNDNQGVGQVPPQPSARLPRDTSPDNPWVARILSRYTSLQEW
jgi:hypothetical protein